MPPVLAPETVVGAGIVLRPWSAADAGLVVLARADPGMQTYQTRIGTVAEAGALGPDTGGDSVRAAAAWCALQADWSDGSHASWAVELDGTGAGGMSLFHLDHDQMTGEAGYWVVPALRGRRVASRALDAASRYGFERLGLLRLQLFHAVSNVGSCGVAERAGFQMEGTLRASYRYGDGRYHDEHSHGRLASDAVEVVTAP